MSKAEPELRRAIRRAISICVALSPIAAHGQAARSADQTLPTVKAVASGAEEQATQIGKLPQSLRDIPQSITVIDREVLDAQAATKLTDALRNVPGITISAGEGGQIGDNINLRGFSARTDLFLDGFRDRGQYSRDTFFLESVEVLKGPASILFGRGSTGGAINQVSKRPELRDSAEVAAAVGTDDYYRLTADVNHQFSDSSALRVVALGHYNESTRDITRSERFGLSPSLRFGIGSDTEITASALLQRNRDIPDYGVPLVQFAGRKAKPIKVPANQFYGFTDDRFDQDVNNFSLTIQHRLKETATLTNLSQYTRYKTIAAPTPLGGLVNPITGAPRGTTNPPPAGTPLDTLYAIRQQRDREIDDSSLYNQTNLVVVVPSRVTQTILAGVELGRDIYGNDRFNRMNSAFTSGDLANLSPIPPVNLGHPDYAAKPPLSASVVRVLSSNTNAAADNAGAYLSDQLDLTPEWKIVAGLRWDRFEVEQNQFDFDYFPTHSGAITTPTIKFTKLTHTDSVLSERAGVIWQPDATQSYYVSYGTSFNPSGESVTLSSSTANLDPEKNRSYEIGAKWSLFDHALLLTSSLFRVEKTNARTNDPQGGTVDVLDGRIRVDGIELSVSGAITDDLRVLTGYSYLDGEIVSSNDVGSGASAGIRAQGKTPQNTPRHSATLWTSYRIAGHWELGGGAVYSSDRFVNNFETAVIDGYVRADLTAAFVQPRYDIRLNALNVTDKVYYETASGGRATPATGRTFIARFAYRF